MAELKTKATAVSVADFLDAVPDPVRRADGKAIAALMARITGKEAKMWGPSIVGFGSYHYKYDSGREGDMCRIGFSPRKGNTVVYIVDGCPSHADIMSRLGKHKTGKSCLYIKRLADVDRDALADLITASLAEMHRRYPPG